MTIYSEMFGSRVGDDDGVMMIPLVDGSVQAVGYGEDVTWAWYFTQGSNEPSSDVVVVRSGCECGDINMSDEDVLSSERESDPGEDPRELPSKEREGDPGEDLRGVLSDQRYVLGKDGMCLALRQISDVDEQAKLTKRFGRNPNLAYCKVCKFLVNPAGHEYRCGQGFKTTPKIIDPGSSAVVEAAWMGDSFHRIVVRMYLLVTNKSMSREESFVSNQAMREVMKLPEFKFWYDSFGLSPVSSVHTYGTAFEYFYAKSGSFRRAYWNQVVDDFKVDKDGFYRQLYAQLVGMGVVDAGWHDCPKG